MKIGHPPDTAAVQIDKMKSRMGRATESHFAVLNTKIIERKQASRSFDPAKVLNPALRTNNKIEEEHKKDDFIKVKTLFMGDGSRKKNALHRTMTRQGTASVPAPGTVRNSLEIQTADTTAPGQPTPTDGMDVT